MQVVYILDIRPLLGAHNSTFGSSRWRPSPSLICIFGHISVTSEVMWVKLYTKIAMATRGSWSPKSHFRKIQHDGDLDSMWHTDGQWHAADRQKVKIEIATKIPMCWLWDRHHLSENVFRTYNCASNLRI